ncbi:hypothetical protein KY284_020810 [Solanum tuberosum]|nr:hypothetical protein KY284_020810 [Solanum tuberosum]
MDSQKSSAGVKTAQISSNHGELFGVVGKPQLIHVNIVEDLKLQRNVNNLYGLDIVSKIMNLSQQGLMKICILSATGGICIVVLHEFATNVGISTYEGQFFIISLSGSVMLSESSRTCDLNVMLSRLDHILFGGYVARKLTAAKLVVVSSLIPEKKKPESKGDDDAPTDGDAMELDTITSTRTSPSFKEALNYPVPRNDFRGKLTPEEVSARMNVYTNEV